MRLKHHLGPDRRKRTMGGKISRCLSLYLAGGLRVLRYIGSRGVKQNPPGDDWQALPGNLRTTLQSTFGTPLLPLLYPIFKTCQLEKDSGKHVVAAQSTCASRVFVGLERHGVKAVAASDHQDSMPTLGKPRPHRSQRRCSSA